jgi:hypothetical protein
LGEAGEGIFGNKADGNPSRQILLVPNNNNNNNNDPTNENNNVGFRVARPLRMCCLPIGEIMAV